jgi:hypothetical protein
MDLAEITERTKIAVRRWAQLPSDAKVLLKDRLDKFQDNDMEGLRVRTNKQFVGEKNFPINSADWAALDPELVSDVRDEADRRINK